MFICDKIANYIAKTDWSLRRHLPKIILLLNLGKIIALDWAYFVHTYLQRVGKKSLKLFQLDLFNIVLNTRTNRFHEQRPDNDLISNPCYLLN